MKQNNNEVYITTYSDSLINLDVDFAIITVSNADIERGNIKKQMKFFQSLKKKEGYLKNGLVLHFEGFDLDSRPVFQIPKIRAWVRKLYRNVPYLFYYLSDMTFTFQLVYLCLCEDLALNFESLEINHNIEQLTQIVNSTIQFSAEIGESREEQSKLADKIFTTVAFR